MTGFIQVTADLDGEQRVSVIPESALPHLPQWTAIDPTDVRANPWDFEEPEDDAPAPEPLAVETVELPEPDRPARRKTTAAGDKSAATTEEVTHG